MPYSVSSARMSIEQFWQARWNGNGRKYGVSLFSAVSQATSQVDLLIFQRRSVSEQSILHLTTVEHLSLLVLFVSLSVFLFLVLHVIKFEYQWSLGLIQNSRNKFLHMKKFASLNMYGYFETSPVSVMCYMSDNQVFFGSDVIGVKIGNSTSLSS